MDALSINYRHNFLATCRATLAQVEEAQTQAERRAILNRQTVQGIKWAMEFVSTIPHAALTEKELAHAIRCTYYRGDRRPIFNP